MIVDNDGNILATGYCGSGMNPNYYDIMLIKYDPVNYDTIWTKSLNRENGFYQDIGTAVTVDSDNNIIITGACEIPETGDPTCGVFKLNENGDLLWKKFFGDITAGFHVITDDNSNIYVDADIISPDEVSIFKLDSDGNEIWINGTPTPTLPTYQDWFKVKLDIQNGDVQWLYLLDEQLEEYPYGIGPQVGYSVDVNPANGNVFRGGYIYNYLDGNVVYEYTVLNFSNYPVNISENDFIKNVPVKSFPNPFSEEISINFRLQLPEHALIVVKNAKGRTVSTLHNGKLSAGDQSIKWDGTNSYGNLLSNGLYFCSLFLGDETHTMKIILQR